MSQPLATPFPIYRLAWSTWALTLVGLCAAALGFHAGLGKMVDVWVGKEEYSHAILVPLIVAFLVWQRRPLLQRMGFEGSWWGFAIVALGSALQVLGRLATLYVVQQYALLLVVYGIVLALAGWRVVKRLGMPLLLLLSMVPLPEFLLKNVSAELQLLSSQLGVWFLRVAGVSVLLEGNVIDLGSYKLEVAEACSGLRYLFPLMTLGLILAYFFQAATWKRAFVFLSSIPVTIVMNSLRVALIGVMVDRWGPAMAQGFLHDFEGWAVFMASIGMLLLEIRLLSMLTGDRRPWRQMLGLNLPPPAPPGARQLTTLPSAALIASAVLLAVFTLATLLLPERRPIVPARSALMEFPLQLEQWSGRRMPLEQVYLNQLQLDDYLVADFSAVNPPDPVNLYIAWYNSQAAGESAHSPRTCIPGGGWRITEFSQRAVDGVRIAGTSLRVNRALIEYGTQRQLVYYWFQQRGRAITSEYLLKWYLLRDSITRNRTDGALVRLTVPLRGGEQAQDGDRQLQQFVAALAPRLENFIPD